MCPRMNAATIIVATAESVNVSAHERSDYYCCNGRNWNLAIFSQNPGLGRSGEKGEGGQAFTGGGGATTISSKIICLNYRLSMASI